jgi:hypothetical protein
LNWPNPWRPPPPSGVYERVRPRCCVQLALNCNSSGHWLFQILSQISPIRSVIWKNVVVIIPWGVSRPFFVKHCWNFVINKIE